MFAPLILLFCLVSLARCQSNNEMPPTITNFAGLEGHNLVISSDPTGRPQLKCTGKGEPEPEYRWFKDGELLTQDNQIGVTLSGDRSQVLEFAGSSVDLLKGYYHCDATNRLGIAKSEVIFVTDLVPEVPMAFSSTDKLEFEEKPETDIVGEGASANFRCSAKKQAGLRDADVIWTKNGQVLEEFSNLNQLTIDKVTTSDIATYACNITNGYDYNYKMFYLNILNQQPIFIERPHNQTVSIGQAAILRCTAKGYPEPTITWTFAGQPITDVEGLKMTDLGDLRVQRVRPEFANGPFVCRARNSLGANEASATLVVVSKTTIHRGPVDMQVQVFDDAKMECTVLWDPNYNLSVSWLKDNVAIVPDGTKFVIDDSNAITIKNLAFEDGGVYTCVASTTMDTDADSGTLEVVGIPPKLLEGPLQMMTVVEGSDIHIRCKVDGYPKPRHTWFMGTERLQISGDRFKVSDDGSLTIRNMQRQDSAKYICRAENNYGQPIIVSGYIDVRSKTKVVKGPDNVVLEKGGDILFDCAVEVDQDLENTVVVNWYKDEEKLELSMEEDESYVVTASPMELTNNVSESDQVDGPKYKLFSNRSLLIVGADSSDVGNYLCHVKTGVDDVQLMAAIYSDEASNWFIILIIVISCMLLLIFLTACIVCVRHRSKRQGRYGVKDVENGKKLNRTLTEIQYSIDDEIEDKERSPLNPEFATPKTLKQISDFTKGSENSLLNLTDEELNLRRGMDEDGSFRGRYLE